MNLRTFLCAGILGCAGVASAAITNYFNFETAPVQPIALGPDGHTLAVCNLPDNRVEFFDVSNGVPVSAGSVAVGIDPVTARFFSENELWVVNHISSTISIVDVAARTVMATLETPAGPGDLVFAGTPRRAWVSCSRTNAVFVIDPLTRAAITNIAIDGERPRNMATSPDGAKVYVAIFESGNGTTVLGRRLTDLLVPPAPGPVDDVNGPYAGADPPPNNGNSFNPPINPLTGPPPRVSHIVRKDPAGRWMDDNNADWTEWVSGTNATISGRVQGWDMPDRDLAIIDTATLQVSYAQRLMNLCMAISVNPVSGEIAVVGTDGTNEKRFEPVLKAVFLRVNLALVDPVTRTNRLLDLNPHLDYVTRLLSPEERALALGDPRGIQWSSDGARAYITGMGSGNLIIVNADGQRVDPQPIELGEGPTGMALDEPRSRLYVWNRFSSSISVVDTTAGAVLTNIAVFDPTPEIVRKGRRHLYDTRRNSGLGHVSCASCHPDARFDRLAWDLGDPAGIQATNGNSTFHPMKGPMVTQTLQDIISMRGLAGPAATQEVSLHWRGDRKNIEQFNSTFRDLLGRDELLTTNEMAEFKQMLSSIFMPPNFLRTFSNTLFEAVTLPGHFGRPVGGVSVPLPPGNPQAGLAAFNITCRRCHVFSSGRSGPVATNLVIPRNGTEGLFLFSQLRNLGEKVGMNGDSTNSRTGFGFMHDGRVDTLSRFLIDGFPRIVGTDQSIANLVAFMLSFSGSDLLPVANPSQDVPAAVGRQVTFGSVMPSMLNAMSDLAMLANSRVDLIVRGKQNGQSRSWLLRRPAGDLQSDRNGEIVPTLTDVLAMAGADHKFTASLVPRGSGHRWALDRDGDGYFDMTETEMGYNPADPESHPGRILSVSRTGANVVLTWESASGLKYAVESTTNSTVTTGNVWETIVSPLLATTNITGYTDAPPVVDWKRFYRVRKDP